MLKTMQKGMNDNLCFNLAEDWAPEAVNSAKEGLNTEPIELTQPPVICASEVLKKMGAGEEAIQVAGFAGGLGLSGHACGALAAVIWFKTLQWCSEHLGESPAFFRNKTANEIITNFKAITNSEMVCSKICGQKFDTINDHSAYIHNGGCKKIIAILAHN